MKTLTAEHTALVRQTSEDFVSSDFRSHVEGGWSTVHPAIRDRMDRMLESPHATVFRGTGCVKRSRIGLFFAVVSRIFGSPLVAKQGEQVTTTVRVAPTENGFRCWHRHFVFPDGGQKLVQTTKMISPTFGMMDVVGARGESLLGTRMRIWSEGKSLCFQSTGYVLRFRSFTVRIPSILTPGVLYAEHRDQGNGSFRYMLSFRHPLWGETFRLFSVVG